MKNIKKLISTALLVAFIVPFTGCNMVEKTPEAKQKSAIAKVNGEKILRRDLDENPRLKQLSMQIEAQYGPNFDKTEQGKEFLKTQKDQILDEMITEKIILQKASELGVDKDKNALSKQVDKKYSEIKKAYNNDEKKLEESLKTTGFNKEGLRKFLKNQIVVEKLIGNITKNVKVTEKEIQDFYNNNKFKFTEKPNTMEVSHILVKSEDEAKKVKKRLESGEDFSKIAKELSQDPGSKNKGGSLGQIEYNNPSFDPTFMRAAMSLKEGEVSNPVNTQFGYHIIKVSKKHEFPVKKLELVKDNIMKELKQKKKQETYTKKIQQWRKDSKIKKYEKNMI